MKTIILLGELGKRYGRKHKLDVKTAAEAVRALCANFKDFAGFVSSSSERNVGYRVINVREDLALDQIHDPVGRTITIAPVIAGAGGGSPLKTILIGAAIIGAAFFTGGASLAATGFWAGGITTTFWGGVAVNIGVGLIIGGVAQMLSPVPKTPSTGNGEADNSTGFNGAVNTTSQGYPVPVGYGRMIVGSAVISAGISVEDFTA